MVFCVWLTTQGFFDNGGLSDPNLAEQVFLISLASEDSPFRLERRARDGAAELTQPEGKLFGWTGLLLLQPPDRRADSCIGETTKSQVDGRHVELWLCESLSEH